MSGLDLQAVSSNGATSTHAISAAGFKLNSTYTNSVSGTSGDIKKINGLPYFHDGTSWKQFYLFGTTAAVTSPDISWEDVQVRMDFETGTLFNYVNGRNASTFTDTTPNTQNISVVSSPVKFGTKSLKLRQMMVMMVYIGMQQSIHFNILLLILYNIDGLDKSVVVVLIGH